MKTFAEHILTELFDKPYPWKWKYWDFEDYGEGFAQAQGDKIKVGFDLGDRNLGLIDIDFSVKTTDGMWVTSATGEGDAGKIFATVMDAIKKFVEKYNKDRKAGKNPNPELNQIKFSASKGELDPKQHGDSRVKLYKRLVDRFGSKVGIKKVQMKDSAGGGMVTFTLFL